MSTEWMAPAAIVISSLTIAVNAYQIVLVRRIKRARQALDEFRRLS